MTEPLDYSLFMLVLGGVALLSVPIRWGLQRAQLGRKFRSDQLSQRHHHKQRKGEVQCRAIAGRRTGRQIGASMIPRAEIYLIVMLHGLTLGVWAVPQELYSAAVIAAVATCIAGPLLVTRRLGLQRQEGQRI